MKDIDRVAREVLAELKYHELLVRTWERRNNITLLLLFLGSFAAFAALSWEGGEYGGQIAFLSFLWIVALVWFSGHCCQKLSEHSVIKTKVLILHDRMQRGNDEDASIWKSDLFGINLEAPPRNNRLYAKTLDELN